MKYKIFFSSVQKEFKEERRALRSYIYGDALLSRFFEVFLFEDLPAIDRRADEVYLEKVESRDIYLGLFGSQYGAVDSDGMSATHKEFLLASQSGKPRFIFVKGDNDAARHSKMLNLLRMAGEQLIRRRFNTTTELPREAVAEGIVNAVVHRNYASNASVQVMLFSDRLEVWNPGTLPSSLTIESLRRPHSSQPCNPLIAEPLFLTKYIEKAGTGTVDMYENCSKAGLKPPEFRLENGFFILTIWRKQALGQPESQPESLNDRVQLLLKYAPLSKSEISVRLGQKKVSGQLNNVIRWLLTEDRIELTIPDKPNSRLQKYRLTKKGVIYLKKQSLNYD